MCQALNILFPTAFIIPVRPGRPCHESEHSGINPDSAVARLNNMYHGEKFDAVTHLVGAMLAIAVAASGDRAPIPINRGSPRSLLNRFAVI
jgi:hypothetical protein